MDQAVISKEIFSLLEKKAREVAKNSYSKYSQFSVGAAILCEDNQVFAGTNVENASFGLTNCAERTAIFSAVSAGYQKVKAVVIYTPTEEPAMPCGACRQVINEFADSTLCISVCDSDKQEIRTIGELLPDSFAL